MTTLEQKIASLSPERQRKIAKRTAELVAEEMSLQAIRKAKGRTQIEVARKLKIKQAGVSKLEGKTDLMISTLRKYVKASSGGDLVMMVEFKDKPPVRIRGLGDIDAQPAKRRA